MIIVSFGLFVSCSKDPKNTPSPPKAAEQVRSEPAAPAPVKLPNTPGGFYETCRERVEGPSVAGECTTNTDCMASGCSKEVCVTGAVGAEMNTTCEIAPCFKVLDTCGCNEGRCSWTLVAELPDDLRGLVEAVNNPQ